MSAFRDYFLDCIANNVDIRICKENVEGLTFEDVCMVIHYMATGRRDVILTKTIMTRGMAKRLRNRTICFNDEMTEELAVLIVAINGCTSYNHLQLPLMDGSGFHKMSRGFVDVAAGCHMLLNSRVQAICKAFDLQYDAIATTDYFENYCQQRQVKSARNIG